MKKRMINTAVLLFALIVFLFSSGFGPLFHTSSLAAWGKSCSSASVNENRRWNVVLQNGSDVPPFVGKRIKELLLKVPNVGRVIVRPSSDSFGNLPRRSFIISLGEASGARLLIDDTELANLGSEAFIVRSGEISGRRAIVARGNPPVPDRYNLGVNRGVLYGAYALLEKIGFAFLHPFEPFVPQALLPPSGEVNLIEKPYWPMRGIHIHTMHPIELTNLLNGWGKSGPDDEDGWREMLQEWKLFLEWEIANRQNMVEWVPLAASSWEEFASSQIRKERFSELVRIAHKWGIAVGVDVPFALQQQHAWTAIRERGELESELSQIRSRIDWVMEAGFDFLGSEMGTSEFVPTEDVRMVAWMDEAARYLDEHYGGKRMYMKIHCSTGQKATNYLDPETGEPLNYNFLAHYADTRLGVMPHSVQFYSLDDPAPTYGNKDFGYMREFLQEEAGVREVLWHPESAYWCTFDIDMPLFFPLYAERRLYDLRAIARDELEGKVGRGEYAGSRINGQMLFSSGWEWGYWLNDVIAARAAWNPQMDEISDRRAFRKALESVVKIFGSAKNELRKILMDIVKAEHDLLVLGKVGGRKPFQITKRNGQGYLEGWDSLDDLGDLIGILPFIDPIHAQPDRLQPVGLYDLFEKSPPYSEVRPLLREMADTFLALSRRLSSVDQMVPHSARKYFEELKDAMEITALRAVQIYGLYDYIYLWDQPKSFRRLRLESARDALDSAMQIAARAAGRYRVEPERVAGWYYNPTSYGFGYLWTAKTLWYWWRDEGKAVMQPLRPGFMNIANPIDQAIGEGPLNDFAIWLRRLGDCIFPGLFEIAGAPKAEPDIGKVKNWIRSF